MFSVDLSNSDLSGANLTEANLQKSTLTNANLSYANLSGAELDAVSAQNVQFYSSNLSHASLASSFLSSSKFNGCNLQGVNFLSAYLSECDFQGSNLRCSELKEAKATKANLKECDIRDSKLIKSDFRWSNLSNCDLSNCDLGWADLSWAELENSNLENSELHGANLIGSNLTDANLSNCSIWGVSAWDVNLDGANQSNLYLISGDGSPGIILEDIEVAHFIYLMLNSKKIRTLMDTASQKIVLILGRFESENFKVLSSIKKKLRKLSYIPVLFDFQKPETSTFIETVSTLAHMSHFVIADFTNPKVVLQEAEHIIRNIVVPFQPLFMKSDSRAPITIPDLWLNHRSVLDTYFYDNSESLIQNLYEDIVVPLEQKSKELADRRIRSIEQQG